MNHFNSRRSRLPLFSFFFSLLAFNCLQAAVITLFVRPYPFVNDPTAEQLRLMLENPRKLGLHMIRNASNMLTTNGLLATYQGYLTSSDMNGQITFPRLQQNNNIKILVTERIIPIIMLGNTIHHWQIDPSVPAALYSYEKTINEKSKTASWKITKIPLPADNRIQLDTITLFAKPTNLYIPQGTMNADMNPNLILPAIYAKKMINTFLPALWVIKVRQFFKPITPDVKKISETYFSERMFQ